MCLCVLCSRVKAGVWCWIHILTIKTKGRLFDRWTFLLRRANPSITYHCLYQIWSSIDRITRAEAISHIKRLIRSVTIFLRTHTHARTPDISGFYKWVLTSTFRCVILFGRSPWGIMVKIFALFAIHARCMMLTSTLTVDHARNGGCRFITIEGATRTSMAIAETGTTQDQVIQSIVVLLWGVGCAHWWINMIIAKSVQFEEFNADIGYFE